MQVSTGRRFSNGRPGRVALLAAAALALSLAWAPAAEAQSGGDSRWFWTTSFYGYAYPSRALPADESGSSPGSVRSNTWALTNVVGYRVNRVFSIFADAPVYFVRFCEEDTAGTERCGNNNGLGDTGLSAQVRLGTDSLNFTSTGTVFLPTGDSDKGLGAGSTTAAWRNGVAVSLLGTSLFGNITLANSLMQTSSFQRPFATRGFVTEINGGIEQRMLPFVHVGVSAYRVMPSGEQRTFGQLRDPASSGEGETGGTGTVAGFFPSDPRIPILDPRFIASQGETVGGEELTRDYGGSAWLRVPLHRNLQFTVAYTRSVRHDLHVVSYGVNVNLSPLIR